MKTIGYFECPTGIAGDMCLGALVDVGVPLDYLREGLEGLGIGAEFELRAGRMIHQGQVGMKVEVEQRGHEGHGHRHLGEIEDMIAGAGLPGRVEGWSLAIFRRLALAEGAVHGVSPSQVHFHEVGAIDAIVDIVGTCLGLDWLGIDQVFCSALPTGGGTVKAAHGVLPVPVPAVLQLWQSRGVPVYDNGIQAELVTPTGAAIVVTLAEEFGGPPSMVLRRVGLGAGSYGLPIPNLLRFWVGEMEDVSGLEGLPEETITVLQTQLDDVSPQVIAYTMERLFGAGALDVFTQPLVMKKSRPGVLLTVICQPEKVSVCERILFAETTTLGIRRSQQKRTILPRKIESVETFYGVVRIKVASWGNQRIANVQPEYEDCAKLAQQHDVSWQEIYRVSLEVWYETHPEFMN